MDWMYCSLPVVFASGMMFLDAVLKQHVLYEHNRRNCQCVCLDFSYIHVYEGAFSMFQTVWLEKLYRYVL